MRRKDREITDINEVIAVMRQCAVVRVALFDGDYPYIVPLNFGVQVNGSTITLYFHCAGEGKKLELIKHCNKAAFEMDRPGRFIDGEKACASTMPFESVCGRGILEVVSNNQEKLEGLTAIMHQYSEKPAFEFDENELRAVTVLKLTVCDITGKRLRIG